MKAEILKIAGVKSEKEFYKKFPTEESFIKVHGKALKKAQMGSMIQGNTSAQFNPKPINFQQLYDQSDMFITGSTQDMREQEAFRLADLQAQQKMSKKGSGVVDAIGKLGSMMGDDAKNGKKLKKALFGDETLPMGKPGMGDMFGKIGKGISAGVGKAGGPMAVAQNVGDIVGGFQQMRDDKNTMKQAQQMAGVSDVAFQASMTRPEPVQRRYVRPDDPGSIVQPGELYNPLGFGTNVLAARNGTEIANTFAPNTIYTDLEEADNGGMFSNFKTNPNFLKLNSSGQETDIFKFAEQGGGDVLSQLTAGIGSPRGQGISGGGRIGGGIGSTLGTIVGGPVGGMIGKFAGQTLGNVLDRKAEKTEQANATTDRNVMSMAFNQGTQGLQQQNYAYMRDGGMANPQVATSLEGIPLTRLFAPDPTMDTLRAGGHLKSYTPPSERAMYTGRDQFAMGGDLETHWGGYAEPMSYNPYLPGGGETVMFRGQSHDESDGKGNTGIGITYGDSPVEVERGEPAVQLRNGSGGDNSLTVFGNLPVTSIGASIIGDDKAKNKKFKNVVADLSKKEQKQNKIVEKSTEKLDDLQVITPQDLLSFEAQKANILGANMKLKDIAKKKQDLASLQSAINDTAEEYGLVADDLAKGKVKQAKMGAKIPTAQKGKAISREEYDEAMKLYNSGKLKEFQQLGMKLMPEYVKSLGVPSGSKKFDDGLPGGRTTSLLEEFNRSVVDPMPDLSGFKVDVDLPTMSASETDKLLGDYLTELQNKNKPFYENYPEIKSKAGKFGIMDIANQILPYVRPTDAEALDPRQLSGEMFALATNQVEPVQAQTIQPQLAAPYDISLQDIINENEADYRAAQRMMGYNPAALAALNAQKYAANQKVLGEQFRLNQAMRDKVFAENRNLLNQSNLQNLGILDQQYGRQQEALSKTKATTQAALNSISAKYLQNQAENRNLQTYENLYNYRFDPRFRAMNMNPLAQFNTQGSGMSGMSPYANLSADELKMLSLQQELVEKQQQKLEKANKPKTSKNGALVKAIKSM